MSLFGPKKSENKNYQSQLKSITGSSPSNLELYFLAMRHSSAGTEERKGFVESNERLEYLGDAVLSMVVAEFLFTKFPFKDEGFLTEIRSRIVNRESLNNLARTIGLADLIQYNGIQNTKSQSFKSIYGNALEALIGAVFLDKGYKVCRTFILKKLIIPHFDITDVINNDKNFKSKIIEWSQKENRAVAFKVVEADSDRHFKRFEARVVLDKKIISKGYGLTKKKAEQDAAEKSCKALKIE
ncbi:MAG: ribonuclease III [Cyclobacteriaceae bacterium]